MRKTFKISSILSGLILLSVLALSWTHIPVKSDAEPGFVYSDIDASANIVKSDFPPVSIPELVNLSTDKKAPFTGFRKTSNDLSTGSLVTFHNNTATHQEYYTSSSFIEASLPGPDIIFPFHYFL